MRAWARIALVLGSGWWLAGVGAQEPERETVPDLDFLEYLGAWADDDDEWLAIEEWRKGDSDDQGHADDEDIERKDDDDAGE